MLARKSREAFLRVGLSSSEAEARLARDGPNEIERRKPYSLVKLLLSQFSSPLIYILVIAGLITLVLKEYVDSGVIWAAVIVNTVLGFWQEFKSAKSLEALQQFLKPQAKVVRNGERVSVPLAEVVVGDVCILASGESVPADGLIVEANDLLVNEAMLTGESVPVRKSAGQKLGYERMASKEWEDLAVKHKVYMGTMVEAGIGTMVVERIGRETQMGEIAASLAETKVEKTPLQQELGQLSKTLAYIVFGAAAVIVVIGLIEGHGFLEMFETAVAVAVAAIPEGMVVALTVVLALGMQRIFKRKALVRKLVAAETLGGVSVICADKTGTLTEGRMRVVKMVAGLKKRQLLTEAAMLSNDQVDPLELAMFSWARKLLKDKHVGLVERVKRLEEMPFSAERKYAASLHQMPSGERKVFLRGAPEVVMARSQLSKLKRKEWEEKLIDFGSKGYRMVGFAVKEGWRETRFRVADLERMEWLGFLAFEDPVRKNVSRALKEAERAGIQVKVITGDYRSTAMAVMERLRLDRGKLEEDEVMDGEQLKRITPTELRRLVKKVRLFVRTTPAEKLKIVEALQAEGEVVGMTGDGVNDAPALKRADIGIVVNEATDVAKETADMVLLDSNFKTIVEAIREGRIIYETIRKVIVYLLSDSFTELVMVAGSLIFRLPLPVTAVQILWVNLVEDSLPNLALAFERNEPDVMKNKPRKRGGSLLDREMRIIIFVIGLATDLLLLGLFLFRYFSGEPIEEVRTFVFVGLGIDSLLYVFSVKTLNRNIWHENLLENKFLVVAVVIGFLLLLPAVHWMPMQQILNTHDLNLLEWGLLLGLGAVEVGAVELVKWAFIHRNKR